MGVLEKVLYVNLFRKSRIYMPYCRKCGTEYVEGAKYCAKCGTPVAEGWRPPREECFGERRRERDYSGLISFGIFLLIVGYILSTNPWIWSEIQTLFMNLGKGVFKPSTRLIYVFALFLGLIGVSNFAIAGVRFAFRRSWRRILSDALSGIGFISFAYFIYQYGQGLMTWRMALLLEIIIIGILVILYGVIASYLKRSQKQFNP